MHGIYCTSCDLQISQAFKLLGMQSSDSSCVAVTVGASRLMDMRSVIDCMSGCEVLSFSDNISQYQSLPHINKVTAALVTTTSTVVQSTLQNPKIV